MALDEDLVDDLWAATGGQAQDKGMSLGWIECLDATCAEEWLLVLSQMYMKVMTSAVHDLLTMYSAMYTETA